MSAHGQLTDRERRVLEAVVQTYIETAEPAASRKLARGFGLGVSPATIRQTMSDLEEKGYLFHPHTSAGRIPTDLAYRTYVDSMLRIRVPSSAVQESLLAGLPPARGTVEDILRRTAQVLGVLTQELGVAVGPSLDTVVLERLELVPVASDRLLLVFNLRSGVVRTIFVQVPGVIAAASTTVVARLLNERLAGLTLAEIRRSLGERLRDAAPGGAAGHELLNIFLAQGEEIFGLGDQPREVVLGSAQPLADQPEFTTSSERMRHLIHLTERHDPLRRALAGHREAGLRVTIGGEHADPDLNQFTLVTASYHAGELSGVIGVLGPTRMPYDKIVSLVVHTSRLVEGLLE
jgi:heat-inducible transcriptional repressor